VASRLSLLRASAFVAVVACVAGCSGVPHGGPVRVVRHVPAEGPDLPEPGLIRRVATNPRPNALPDEIVRGYLTAQTDPVNDHAIARKYLAPGVAWKPSARVTVYANPRIGRPSVTGDAATVGAAVDAVGVIGPGGAFRPAESPVGATSFRLRRVPDVGWRITNPRPGVLLTRDEVKGAYQRTTLYWLDTARRLVPEPVFLPQSDQPVGTVVRALLAGPKGPIAPSVRTVIPPGTELLDPPSFVDGIVSLNFSREIRLTLPETRAAFVAQVVWTLTDLLGVDAVRFSAEGDQLTIAGHPQKEQRRAAWTSYAPVPAPSDARLFFVRDGAAYAMDDAGHFARIGRPTPPLESLAVNRAGTVLAAVTRPSGGRQSLLFVDVTGSAAPRLALSADALGAPTWERGDAVVWLVRGVGSAARPVAVPAPRSTGFSGLPITLGVRGVSSVRLSPDGARAVFVVGTGARAALWSARIAATRAGRRVLADPRLLVPSVRSVTAAAFDGASQVLFATLVRGRPQLYRVDLDGYNLVRQRDDGFPSGAITSLTVSAGSDFGAPVDRVASVDGRLWRRTPGADWAALPGRGVAAAYAG
jgi:hypothetical protein